MRKLVHSVAVAASLACLALPALAVDFVTTKSPDIFIATPSVGLSGHTAKIKTKDGHQLRFGFGINRKTWKVDLVIMTVGGFLGLGSKCVALPPTHAQAIEQSVEVDLLLDELKNGPSFNGDRY